MRKTNFSSQELDRTNFGQTRGTEKKTEPSVFRVFLILRIGDRCSHTFRPRRVFAVLGKSIWDWCTDGDGDWLNVELLQLVDKKYVLI